MKKGILILAIIVILGLGIFGIFLLNQEKVNPGDLNTDNWKTYKNDEFGYSFKYPERFSNIHPLIQGYEGGNVLSDEDVSVIRVYVVTKPHPLEEGSEDLVINGHRAKLTTPFGEYQTDINIYKDENLISIRLINANNKINQNDENLFMKIISTIELTD